MNIECSNEWTSARDWYFIKIPIARKTISLIFRGTVFNGTRLEQIFIKCATSILTKGRSTQCEFKFNFIVSRSD